MVGPFRPKLRCYSMAVIGRNELECGGKSKSGFSIT